MRNPAHVEGGVAVCDKLRTILQPPALLRDRIKQKSGVKFSLRGREGKPGEKVFSDLVFVSPYLSYSDLIENKLN